MVIIEHRDIELDYCTICRGVWFDTGELELLLELGGLPDPAPFIDSMKGRTEPATAEKPRRCPVCRQKMKKSAVTEGGEVLVDVCPDDHGIWFDHREVEHLAAALAQQSQDADEASRLVLAFLDDVFKY